MRRTLLTLLTMLPAALTAQDTLPGLPRGYAVGLSFDEYLLEGHEIPALAFRVVGLAPRRWTSEFALGALLGRDTGHLSVLTFELGTAYNAPFREEHGLLRAGASGLFAVSDGGGGGLVGVYLGAGGIIRVTDGLGARLDVTRHWFVTAIGPVGVWRLGAGLAALPRAGS